jgi:hypothetical protein
VRLLAYDERRLGLRPVYRRVWARRGERPLAVGAHRYRWFYVCTFVEPETGESLSLLVDGVDTEVMGWVLRELRAWLGEGEEAWVVLDRAGWHVSGRVEVPEGVGLVFLPPYSPELQPVERVWPLVDAAVANRDGWTTLGELMGEGGGRAVPGTWRMPRRPSGGTPSSTGGLGRGTQQKRV